MCPLVVPDGRFDDEVNYPGCLLSEPSDGGITEVEDDVSSEDESMSTITIIAIVGGVVVLGLVGVVVMMLTKKPQSKKSRSGPKVMTDLPSPELPESSQDNSEETSADDGESSGEETIDSWEDLPAGDYLDPDENGTVWFQANDGSSWYQNSDETWTKWND